MSNDETSYRVYWDHVESLADAVVQRVNEEGAEEGDALHEAVDGSWWITYFHAARAVMQHTEHDDYGLDEGLIDLKGCDSFDSIVVRFAFWALYADVVEALEKARERWAKEHPEKEEPEGPEA